MSDRGSPSAAIAYLSTHYPGVTHTFIQREVLELREQGVPVDTFSINTINDDQIQTSIDSSERETTVFLKGLGVSKMCWFFACAVVAHPLALLSTLRLAGRDVGFDIGRRVRRWMQVGEGILLEAICRRRGITHIHAQMGQAPANIARFATHFANAAFPGRGAKWSVTIHGPQDCLDEPTQLLVAKMESAEFVVAVSDFTKAQLLRQVPTPMWSNVHTVRCGIDLGIETALPGGQDSCPFRILVVARISPEKGHGILLQAVAYLRDRGVDVRLELVGPGDFDGTFGDLADQLSIRELVTATGSVPPDEVISRMRSADVLCLPSFAEGLPVVIMEAMAVGLPVVASGISGVPELIEQGVTGLLVIPARPDLLADALQRLAVDNELRAHLATEARRRVEQLHDGKSNVATLAELFRNSASN